MRAITVVGGKKSPTPPFLKLVSDFPLPTLTSSHPLLIKVSHTALNRADLMQKAGLYPPPKWSPCRGILGLECAGEVVEVLKNDDQNNSISNPKNFKPGDRVMALLEGGGYADYAAAAPGSVMHIPKNMSNAEAACLPEAWLTAYQLLYKVGRLNDGENLLIHAGASGVSLAAARLASACRLAGRAKTVTSLLRTMSKTEAISRINADNNGSSSGSSTHTRIEAVDREIFFSPAQTTDPDRKKFDVILDSVCGEYFGKQLKDYTNTDARVVVYAAMGHHHGTKGSPLPDHFDPRFIFLKRLQILGSTLRGQKLEYKRELVFEFEKNVLGDEGFPLRVDLDSVFTFGEAGAEEALERMEGNLNSGKMVLEM